ncbi:hypothetical protein LA303_03155 [Candidatus Sulfidibacterium hydrothermale]|uniref:hypothetical protein n=1 Tax=Candidatus Sulfidibacterium hydrothermale TaxID=2875962 RepID=UPI001F0B1E60|nr:hypothetical protein [Candidatus Sulfidibacterium hydrothermale]UBM62984.1 hypothetical protein LA303_03155 [Candidatus Sulfidibacterium hydrothermale]
MWEKFFRAAGQAAALSVLAAIAKSRFRHTGCRASGGRFQPVAAHGFWLLRAATAIAAAEEIPKDKKSTSFVLLSNAKHRTKC